MLSGEVRCMVVFVLTVADLGWRQETVMKFKTRAYHRSQMTACWVTAFGSIMLSAPLRS